MNAQPSTVHDPRSTFHGPRSYPIRVSWLLFRDLDRVEAIERASFPYPWARRDFLHALACGEGIICYAAELDGTLAGYLVRRMHVGRDVITNLAVAPEYRRQGVARALVADLQLRMHLTGRRKIVAEVADWNLDAQIFFRAMDFRAVKVLRNYYAECAGDAYGFVWRCGHPWEEMQEDTTETRRARR